MPGFVLLVRSRGDDDDTLRLGLTVSKKVGNSVTRNRMKRRLREIARIVLPEAGIRGADHVIIGRTGGNDLPFDQLQRDLRQALQRVGTKPIRNSETNEAKN